MREICKYETSISDVRCITYLRYIAPSHKDSSRIFQGLIQRITHVSQKAGPTCNNIGTTLTQKRGDYTNEYQTHHTTNYTYYT